MQQAQIAIANISPTKKEITLEIGAGTVKAEFDKAYDTLSQQVKWPGFRPGKVPRDLLKKRFGAEVKEQVLQQLLPHALQHAIIDHQLNFVGDPAISDLLLEENEPLKCKVSIEVIPDFELQQYKGLKVTKRVKQVTEAGVDRVLARWQETAAEFVPVEERASEQGDFVSVNLVGKYADEPDAPEMKADGVDVELGSPAVLPEFEQHLTGVRPGDVREFRAAYPADFPEASLAGKTLDFKATIMAVRKKETPELDDDFAQEFGNYESLAQLRDLVRADLQRMAELDAQGRMRDKLLRQLLRSHDFEAPEVLVKQQAEAIVENLRLDLLRQGVAPETVSKLNWEGQSGEIINQAVREIRTSLILGRIAIAEKIKVTDDDVDTQISYLAARSQTTPDELKARLTKENALSSIKNQLLFQKTQEFIVNRAEIKVEEIAEDQDDQEAETPDAASAPATEAAQQAE